MASGIELKQIFLEMLVFDFRTLNTFGTVVLGSIAHLWEVKVFLKKPLNMVYCRCKQGSRRF